MRLAILWYIWKRRNAKVFNREDPLQSKISTTIFIESFGLISAITSQMNGGALGGDLHELTIPRLPG